MLCHFINTTCKLHKWPPTCDFAYRVSVASLNTLGSGCCEESLFIDSTTNIKVYVHGQVRNLNPFCCLTHGYAIAKSIVESILEAPKRSQLCIHVYLSKNIAKQILGEDAGYADFRTMKVHIYPWNSFAHEITHMITYTVFGGRAFHRILEEGLACFFAHIFVTPHIRTRAEYLTNGQEFLFRTVMKSSFSSPNERAICGSFIGFVLEKHGLQRMKILWSLDQRFEIAFQKVYVMPLEEAMLLWVDYLVDNESCIWTSVLDGELKVFQNYELCFGQAMRRIIQECNNMF